MPNEKKEDSLKKKCIARLESWMSRWTVSETRGAVIDYDDVSALGKHFNIYTGSWTMHTKKGKRDIIVHFGVKNILWVYLIECKAEFGAQRPEQVLYERKFEPFLNVVYELVYEPTQIDRTLDALTGRTDALLKEAGEWMGLLGAKKPEKVIREVPFLTKLRRAKIESKVTPTGKQWKFMKARIE